jgi:hypothetical protein
VTDRWFDDVPVLGAMEHDVAVELLEGLEEPIFSDRYNAPPAFGRSRNAFKRPARAWEHTSHAFGFVESAKSGTSAPLPIVHAGAMSPDETLRGASIRVTLDRLRVVEYPGSGLHRLLFDFYAQNQVTAGVEHLHFNATLRAREGESVATVGFPIFSGLNVGPEGIAFKCFTVNVKNDDDEALLGFLESDVFKTGLQLATVAQPALGPLSAMAFGLTEAVAKRSRNVAVQDFYLGLDFSDIPFRARLATGSYIAVQIAETLTSVWRWDDWVYVPETGQIANRRDHTQLMPHNYLVFSVSRMVDAI